MKIMSPSFATNIFRTVGLLYLVSSLWCLLNPTLAMEYLSLRAHSALAKAEFVAVYGGLQLGIAIAILVASWSSKQLMIGTLFCVCIQSFMLIVCRILGLLLYAVSIDLLVIAALELTLFILLFVILKYFGGLGGLLKA